MATPSDSDGTSYTKSSTYLFVPRKSVVAATAAADENKPGAYFRLGGYSNVEASAVSKADFYPRRHIEDATADGIKSANAALATQTTGGAEGPTATEIADARRVASDAAVLAQADGGGATNAGIMLACNGRVLLRAEERVYIHGKGKIDIDSEEEIDLRSGKYISLKSSSIANAYRHAANRAAATNGIEIIGAMHTPTKSVNGVEVKNPGTGGQVFIEADELYVQVAGTSTADITADGVTNVNGDQLTTINGDQRTTVKGFVRDDFMGHVTSFNRSTSFSFSAGAGISIAVSASLSISATCDIEIGLLSIGFTGIDITKTGVEIKQADVDAKIAAIKTRLGLVKAEKSATSMDSSEIQMTVNPLYVGSSAIESTTGGVRSSMIGLNSNL